MYKVNYIAWRLGGGEETTSSFETFEKTLLEGKMKLPEWVRWDIISS